MVVNESDEVLRRIVFGQGSSPEQVRAASDELQRRSSGGLVKKPAPTVEDAVDAEADPLNGQVVPSQVRSKWSSRVLISVAAVVGCGLGIMGTVGYYGAGGGQEPGSLGGLGAGMSNTVTQVINPDTNETLFQVPGFDGAGDPPDADRWFAGPQTEQDALPISTDFIDPSSTRSVGRIGDDAGAWIAKGTAGEYCAIIAFDDGVTSSSSCASQYGFVRSGTLVGIGEDTLFWNPASVILSSTRL